MITARPPTVVTALVVGDRNSGRSCLVNRMQRDTFPGAMRDAPSDQGSEAALSGWSRRVALSDDVSISVAIYDTPLNSRRVTPHQGDSFSARRRTPPLTPCGDTLSGKQTIGSASPLLWLPIPEGEATVVESHLGPMQIPSDEHFRLLDVVIFAVPCETVFGEREPVTADSLATAVRRLAMWFDCLKRHGGAWIVVGTKWDLCRRNGQAEPTNADRETFVESLVVPAARLARVAVGESQSDLALPFIGGVFLTSAVEDFGVREQLMLAIAKLGGETTALRHERRSSASVTHPRRPRVSRLDKAIDQAVLSGITGPVISRSSTMNVTSLIAAASFLLLLLVGGVVSSAS